MWSYLETPYKIIVVFTQGFHDQQKFVFRNVAHVMESTHNIKLIPNSAGIFLCDFAGIIAYWPFFSVNNLTIFQF